MPFSIHLLDLREQDGRYYFRIGNGRDFNDALLALKAAIAPRDRNWDPVTCEWDVPATQYSEDRLCAIFPNAANAFLALKSQMRMF
jgi:hypothetical protein